MKNPLPYYRPGYPGRPTRPGGRIIGLVSVGETAYAVTAGMKAFPETIIKKSRKI